MHMPRIAIPDDAPPVLRASAVWPSLAAARHGVIVTDSPGVSAISIAEHALALLG